MRALGLEARCVAEPPALIRLAQHGRDSRREGRRIAGSHEHRGAAILEDLGELVQ
jgi:hypothetical protein